MGSIQTDGGQVIHSSSEKSRSDTVHQGGKGGSTEHRTVSQTRSEGDHQKAFSADGAQWYKQQAVDTVAKTPYKAPDGEIAYNQEIVKRMPAPPKRKDRM